MMARLAAITRRSQRSVLAAGGGLAAGSAIPLVQPAANPVASGLCTVLVVEDEQIVRLVQRDVLSEAGCTVLEAADATTALAVAAAHAGPIDVLVTDLELPGLRGCELAARLQVLRPGIGIVFTSGYGEDQAPCDRFPGSLFLQKPFTVDGLAAAVAAVSGAPVPAAVA